MIRNLKKYIIFTLVLNMMFSFFCPEKLFAEEPVEILAESAILVNRKTGDVLYEYNSDAQLAPASLTKIMSLILIFENIENGNISKDEMLTCSEYANSINGSQIWLDEGEKMTVEDLLKAVIISSANDATVVFAERIAGSERNFVDMMNERAKTMGLKSTHFENCTGLDLDGHLTTAREVAIVARELLNHNDIFNYSKVWMDSLRDGKTELVNTNRLIRFYPGSDGLKTGTSDNAGCCLAASATRNGLSLVSVVMGAKNTDERFLMSKMLLNYGFDNFASVKIDDIQKELENLKVEKGDQEYLSLKAAAPPEVLIEKSKKNKIKQQINLPKSIEAPIVENQIVGSVSVFIDNKKILEYPVTASYSVGKIKFLTALKKILLDIISF